jgi:hypothetical protein
MNDRFLKIASDRNLADDLSREIERKLCDLDDMKGLPYGKPDIVQLIDTIEKAKMKCLHEPYERKATAPGNRSQTYPLQDNASRI